MSAHAAAGGGRRRRGGGDHDEEHENGERWLLSYADFITLLLALFMVLFALSTIDRNKFAAFRTGLVSAFDSSANASPTVPGGTGLLSESSLVKSAGSSKLLSETKPTPVTAQIKSGSSDQTEAAAKAIEAKLKGKGLAGMVDIVETDRGLVIRLRTDKVFFSSGSAALAGKGAEVVDLVGAALKSLPNQISVEGHTDNQPIATAQYPTNWELSTARAVTVLRRLAESDHVNAGHLEAAGYGAERPIVANDTDADRARNRRVEIVVLPLTTSATNAAAPATAAGGSTVATISGDGSTVAAGTGANATAGAAGSGTATTSTTTSTTATTSTATTSTGAGSAPTGSTTSTARTGGS